LKTKNVLIITHNFPPESVGRAARINQLSKFLSQFHKIIVAAPPPTWPFTKYKKAGYFFKSEKFENVEVKRIWTLQPSKEIPTFFENFGYFFIFPFLTTFYLISKATKFSTVIISTPPSYLLLISPIIRLFRKRFIIDVGDLPMEQNIDPNNVRKHSFLNKKIRKFEINCWKNADVVITNNLGIRDEIQKILKDNCPMKVKYFPFNVDSHKFKKLDVKQEKQLVYIGSFSAAQNLQAIVKAMSIIIKKIPDIKLQLYGGGADESQLKSLIKDLDLEQSCKINSPVTPEQIPLILSKSIIGIVALSMNEHFHSAMPTKTREYMACSLPVFAYGASEELARVIKESKSGKSVKSEDPKELAENLLSMLNDPAALEQFSNNGRNFIERNQENTELAEFI